MNRSLRSQIIAIISGVDDMTIATIREDGCPQATTVSYVNDDEVIYFFTTRNAQKVRNIDRDERVSLTINSPYDDWNDIEGLSITGTARFVTEPEEQARVGELLLEKFPQVAEIAADDSEEIVLVRVDPQWISVLDYAKGFGHTELVTLNDECPAVDENIRARYPE